MITVRYDQTLGSANAKIQVDDGSVTSLNKLNNSNTTSNATGSGKIARYGTLTSGYLDGNFDEYSIWDRVLTDAEVTELYNIGEGLEIY